VTDPVPPRAPRQSLPVNLGLGILVLGLVLGALEGLARVFERPRPAHAVASYIWDWEDKWSGEFYTVGSGAVGWPPWEEWNADGMRDRAHPAEKLDGLRRLVFLGDSVTLGAGIEARQAYPQVLQERLDREGGRVEVFNVALWGWSTRQELIAYRRIARKYRPDAVVVGVCLNDIPELQNNLSRPPDWLGALFRRSALVRRLLDAEGREIRSVEELFTQADDARVRQGLERFFAELRSLRDEVRADRASLALLVLPFRFQLEAGAPPPSVQGRIASFCAAEKIPCLDLLPRLRSLGVSAFLDYDHLSVKGSEAAADAVLEAGLPPAVPSERAILAARPGEDALALLAAGDADTRAAAAWGLRADPGGVEPLARALRVDESPLVRFRAAGSLGALGVNARGASAALFEALRDEHQPVRWAAAQALWKAGLQAPADLEPLVQALANPDPYVRSFAAWSLGEMGPAAQETVPALVEALRLEEGEGGAAARALAKLGPVAAGAVPALVEQLKSPEDRRRFTAAEALGRIGSPARSAVPRLIESLRDDDGRVRSSAAQALGRIGPEARSAVSALEAVLKSDEDPHSRALAARALGQIGPASRSAVGTLNAAAHDPDPSVRREVAKALPRIHEH
jgi:HEAT repeat protein/lysophospholipase L1-like esterase